MVDRCEGTSFFAKQIYHMYVLYVRIYIYIICMYMYV